MSSVTELQNEVVSNYIATSATVLFFYDSVITLCDEVNVIWRRKWTAMTWIYAFTRYCTVANGIVVSVPYYGNFESCKAASYIYETFFLIQFPCFALVSALRVYALSDGRRIMAILVFLLNLVPFATNMFSFTTQRIIWDSENCIDYPSGSARLNLFLSLVSRISVTVGDIIVLIVTWVKTAQSYSEARRLKISAPLSMMLIRDGTLYFIILVAINVLQLLGKNDTILANLDVTGPFLENLPPLIVCRFILNLRHVRPSGDSSSCASGTRSNSTRFIGNVGESLRFGGDEEEENELEGDENAAGLDTMPELASGTEASSLGQANEGEAGIHLDCGIKEVPAQCDV